MFRADVKTLGAALSRVAPVVYWRNAIPILSMARLTTEAGVLTAAGTNLDMQIEADALVEVTREAQVMVSPRQVLGILRYLPKLDCVELTAEGEAVYLSWPGGRARVSTLPSGDWPMLQFAGDELSARIGEEDYTAFRRVWPFISDEETRYYLNGVGLDIVGGVGVAVATDGHRLASMPISSGLTAIPANLRKPIIPRKAVQMMLGLGAGEANVIFHRKNDGAPTMELSGDGVRLKSKLIDGSYPDWKRVLPADTNLELEVSRADLMRACSLAGQFVGGAHHDVVLLADKGRVQLLTAKFEGELAIHVGPAPAGLKWELPINANLLLKVVAAARGTTVRLMAMSPSAEPLIVVGSEVHAGEHIVVMPLRSAPRLPSFAAPLREAA